jgi:MFS family permease
MNETIPLYPRRWVVLGSFMFINLTIQTLWISFASISGPAAAYYGVSDLAIGFLAMSFMIAFIPLSIPVSWAIDTFGFRLPVGLGAVLMGIFGVFRGFAGQSYTLVLIGTLGIAVSQPFLLNAWTKVPAAWFPVGQRATAVGLITLANLAGTALGMILPPILLGAHFTIGSIQLVFGSIALFSAVLFLTQARERPPTPPCGEEDGVRSLMLDGLKHALTVKAFRFTLLVSFIGLGIFNGITTWIENIIRLRGFTPGDAGNLGALMILGGIIGAVLIPALSDREGKRQKYLFITLAGAIPGLIGLTFARDGITLYASAFALGFFLVSAIPVAMQYAAEITRPTPEGTSNGLIQLFGQGAVVFVYLMEAMKTKEGSFTPALLFAAGLLLLSLFFVTGMKDRRR